MPPTRTPRHPISIDNDESIDFSAVAKSTTSTRPAAPLTLLQSETGLQQQQQQAPPAQQAQDPRLKAYTHRALPRRRLGFGGAAITTMTPAVGTGTGASSENMKLSSTASVTNASIKNTNNNISNSTNTATNNDNNNNDNNSGNTSKALIDALWREEAVRKETESYQSRRETYEHQLQALLHSGATTTLRDDADKKEVVPPITYSLLDQFFASGVPDVEPWDLWALSIPRYGVANIAGSGMDRVYHPVLPETHYSQHYMHKDEEKPIVIKVMKTREELRAERRERLRKAKEERDRAKRLAHQKQQQQQGQEEVTNGDTLTSKSVTVKDRLSNSNLRYNLFSESVLNPLSTENKVFSQYQERFLEHQRRNHERHVAAIPHQIEKRKRNLHRHAEENPVFRAYRIFPIYTPAHLGKLRNFANDGLLRGFILWVCNCDALVVLTGGEVAVRHVERWILEKMQWESPETVAVRLMTSPLQDAATFSFVSAKSRKRALQQKNNTVPAGNSNSGSGEQETGEHVYMNFVDNVRDAERFMQSMPTEGPWRDLTHVWRASLTSGMGVGG
ncbi:uncharacterized protein TM35_000061990 [Trypanosoma theileri]|uniref:Uncharacterized protein n=1 Tax=Trypanosoma theileri TaxID=67003 RepID=A0A1X0P2M3_9TRYP|nr:uncharacterized protein TM35_000061990 [Trypanosoma theileri]ORC91194.1 hypothetical protein TM35_000061990 [Trypanosoma theileri]